MEGDGDWDWTEASSTTPSRPQANQNEAAKWEGFMGGKRLKRDYSLSYCSEYFNPDEINFFYIEKNST